MKKVDEETECGITFWTFFYQPWYVDDIVIVKEHVV